MGLSIETYADPTTPGDWITRIIQSDGEVLVVTFSGLEASRHAKEYANWCQTEANNKETWRYDPAKAATEPPGANP